MGRQTRQGRRTSGRRQETRQVHTPAKKTQPWQIAAGVVLVLAVAAVLAVLAFKPGSASGTDVTKAATQGEKTAHKVDGKIGCNAMEQITYHVHAHLAVLVDGKQKLLDRYAGLNYAHDCLYWLHAHDQSGIVHIESPHKILPTLGTWYDVMKLPLSPTQGSTSLARTVPEENCARKRAGMLSRFFASSECSKWPRNANGHVPGRRFGPEWRSGRSPATPVDC